MPVIVHLRDTFKVYSFIAEKCWTQAIIRYTCQFICSVRLLSLPFVSAIFSFSSWTHWGHNWLLKWNFNESARHQECQDCLWVLGVCVHTCAHTLTPTCRPLNSSISLVGHTWKGQHTAPKGCSGTGKASMYQDWGGVAFLWKVSMLVIVKIRAQKSQFLKKYKNVKWAHLLQISQAFPLLTFRE